jgi:hypothetical protein
MVERSIHEPAVCYCPAGDVVPATSHGDQQAMGPGQIDGRYDIGLIDTTSDQTGFPVYHAIPYSPPCLVF